MQMVHSPATGPTRRLRALLGTAALALAACSGEPNAPDAPQLPADVPLNPTLKSAAFIFDVNTARKTVKVTVPGRTVNGLSAGLSAGNPGGISGSLVASDVIDLSVGGYTASGVGTGGADAGKVLVTFDLQITNKLASVALIKPTWPVPPSALDQIYAFPIRNVVTTTSGGVSASGNEVIVELPSFGEVAPSSDWNLAPHNWFNDDGCAAGSNDCYRSEPYAAPLGALQFTAAQRVGFMIDPTVANFRSYIIVVADLQNTGAATTADVSGTVSSNVGPLSGVTVSVTGAGSGTTNGSGAYTVPSVGPGPRTVSITAGLPTGCTYGGPQNITMSGAAQVVNFTATCPFNGGTVNGAITRTGIATSLAGVTVTINPDDAGAANANTTVTAGLTYGASVQVGTLGTGSISFGALPAGCSFVGANTASYTGLSSGGTVNATGVTVDCVAPPAPDYPFTLTWGTPSGGSITATLAIDMSVRNEANNNGAGADEISAFEGTFSFGSRVGLATSCSGSSGFAGGINIGGVTGGSLLPSGTISFALFNSSNPQGLVTLATCTFPHTAGTGTTAVSGSTYLFAERNGIDFNALVAKTLNTIP